MLVGCYKSVPTEVSRKIRFASQYNRALVENNEDLQTQELKLFGAYSINDRTVQVFDAERLYYDATLPGWDYETPQYWMSGASYCFCAISPYTLPCTFDANEGRVIMNYYECRSGSPDLLYAVALRDLSAGDDFSTVPLHFHHACAAVKFNIINASNATVKDVRNIRLVGLYNKGHFSFGGDGSVSWELNGDTVESSSQIFGGSCTLPSGGLIVNLNNKHSLYDYGTLLVPPQSVYKTSVTLHLEYIKEGDASYAIRNIELGKLNGVIPTEWKSGEKYEYNLTITDNNITTEVRVVPWVDHYVDL